MLMTCNFFRPIQGDELRKKDKEPKSQLRINRAGIRKS